VAAPKRRPHPTPESAPAASGHRRADLSAAASRFAPTPPSHPAAASTAAAAAGELDRLVHERVRLGILSALAAQSPTGSCTFNDLKSLLGATDGNVSVHARKLEEAGYIACTKSFDGRVPRTEYRITPDGRAALDRYLDHMEALIRAARGR
jgi:DNA-binding MarR family transcriptional regulator